MSDQQNEVVHACPADGAMSTGCCGLPPFELPRRDRMTNDASVVTCWTGSDPRLGQGGRRG